MARTLVQALEGISFPCDRSKIVDYARQQDIAPRALEYLQQLPEQRFNDMTELFRALPSKSQRRPRLNVVERQAQERGRESLALEEKGAQAEDRQVAAEEGEEAEEPEEPEAAWLEPEPATVREAVSEMAPQWQQAFGQSMFAQPTNFLDATLQWQRMWLELWGKTAEAYGAMVMPWLRR